MRYFTPCYRSTAGSACYNLLGYSVDSNLNVTAHFEDGYSRPSVFPTLDALLDAGRKDWNERVREVSALPTV